jgi:hypothetical protein
MTLMNASLSTPRRRRLLVPIIATFIASASLASGSVPAIGQDDEEPAAPFAFERADVPSAPAGMELWDVVAGGPGFVAVGGGFAEGDEASTAIIWVSDDGRAWQSVPLFGDAATGVPRAVTAMADGFVAVGSGCCPDEAAVWLSPDGLAWERLPASPSLVGSAMLDVASTADGIVAVGCRAELECFSGLAWTSPDGRTWGDPVDLDEVDLLPLAVAATEAGVLALGSGSAFGDAARLALSPDGATWSTATTISSGGGSMEVAIERPEGILAAGGATDPGTDTNGALLATSEDGALWVPRQPRSLRGTWVEDIADLGDGLVLVGWRTRRGDQIPDAAWTADLATFTRLDLPSELKDSGALHATAAAPDGSSLVAVGYNILNRGLVPTVFVSASPTED